MIVLIDGKILSFSDEDRYTVLEVYTHLGLGYKVLVPLRFKGKVGEEIRLYTSFVVKEDSQTLYGFQSKTERDIFELLTTVSGVGPKTALSVLSVYSPDEISSFIVNKNSDEFSRVPGLGKKGAQKIVLELENKMEKYGFDMSSDISSKKILVRELSTALKSLGFSGSALDGYIKKGEKISSKVENIDELIKLVLQDN